MRFLYPSNPFQKKQPDENYAEEYAACIAAGLPVALFSYEQFSMGTFSVSPKLEDNEVICYRGWMLTAEDYQKLCNSIQKSGGTALTSPCDYERCHYLPSWYHQLKEWTPETHFFQETDNIEEALRKLGWSECFLKDYVKSLSTDGGSLIRDLTTIPTVIQKMKKYRGQIEGGLCARQIEDFDLSSEIRHFIFQGVTHSPSGAVPDIVRNVADLIKSPFYSVDTIQKMDGSIRIIELGDGQVSDLKMWKPDDFVRIFQR